MKIELQTRFNSYSFEIVDRIPKGYGIWNIGDCLNGYIPLFEPMYPKYTNDKDQKYHINRNTLKVIKVEDSSIIMKAASYGCTIKELEKELNKKSTDQYIKNRIEKALPLIKNLEWEA